MMLHKIYALYVIFKIILRFSEVPCENYNISAVLCKIKVKGLLSSHLTRFPQDRKREAVYFVSSKYGRKSNTMKLGNRWMLPVLFFKQSLVYAGVFHLGSTSGLRGSGRTPEVKRKFFVHLHSSF